MKSEKIFLEPGDILFREGEASAGLYLIDQGLVEVVRIRKNVEVVLAVMAVGEVIGTVTYLTGEPRMATARAKNKTTVSFFPFKQFSQGMTELPLWAQAVLKDTIRRLRDADDALVEASENERRLKMEVGNVFSHSAQMSFLLSSLMRKATILDDVKTPIYPIKDFLPMTEMILFRNYNYWEKILAAFDKHRLIKIESNQKYGKVVVNPNPQFLEDFGYFSKDISRKGIKNFTPIKYHKWLTTLLTLSKKYNKVQALEKTRIREYFEKEANMKDELEEMIVDLHAYYLLDDKGSSVHFSYDKIKKTIIYENTLREIKDIVW